MFSQEVWVKHRKIVDQNTIKNEMSSEFGRTARYLLAYSWLLWQSHLSGDCVLKSGAREIMLNPRRLLRHQEGW